MDASEKFVRHVSQVAMKLVSSEHHSQRSQHQDEHCGAAGWAVARLVRRGHPVVPPKQQQYNQLAFYIKKNTTKLP